MSITNCVHVFIYKSQSKLCFVTIKNTEDTIWTNNQRTYLGYITYFQSSDKLWLNKRK